MAAPRFPGLAKLFLGRNRGRGMGEIERVLSFYADRGEIDLTHPLPLLSRRSAGIVANKLPSWRNRR